MTCVPPGNFSDCLSLFVELNYILFSFFSAIEEHDTTVPMADFLKD